MERSLVPTALLFNSWFQGRVNVEVIIVDIVMVSLGLKAMISLRTRSSARPSARRSLKTFHQRRGGRFLPQVRSSGAVTRGVTCGSSRWLPCHDSVALVFLLSVLLGDWVFPHLSLVVIFLDLVGLSKPTS